MQRFSSGEETARSSDLGSRLAVDPR